MSTTVSNLESLIRITIDSAEGYERAAETAKSEQLKQTLREQSTQRRDTVAERNEELVRIGGQAQERGSATGAVHNIWTRIADAFGDDDEAATERVEEGEDYIEEKFQEALEHQDWDPRTREILQRAHSRISEGERLTDRLEERYD
jgi:uncharacterized protein (TIGR02284 family)